MDYGNTGGAEFNWNYSMGGNGGGGGASSIYPQMGQMGGNNGGYGGGPQWLHSNQGHGNPANQSNYQMSNMGQGQGQNGGPFDDYNQSMMRYTNVSKVGGKSDMFGSGMEQGQGAMGMNSMGNNYGGYPSAMTRNGLGDPSVGMGGGMGGGNSGAYGGSSW